MDSQKANLPPISRKLLEFTGILRDAGVKISADEILTLFEACTEIPVEEKDVFRQTLKTTLIKDYTDIPVFDRCFDEYFSGRERVFDGLTERSMDVLSGTIPEEMIRDLNSQLDDFLDSLDPSILFERSSEEIMNMFLEELPESESGGGGGINLFRTRGSSSGSYQSRTENVETDGPDMQEIMELVDNLLKNKISRRSIGREMKDRDDYLLNKFIYQLSPEEIKEMKETISRFGQKLKSRISLRKKRVKHGGIDIKRTFRTNLQYGGVPFKLFYKNKKIDRPQLVVLCDISRSVNQYSRFMLLLTYTLQSLFSKVRTFAFISSMVEITDLFREMDPERAINSMFADTNFTYGWGSNYGNCFDQFMNNYSDAINRKTSVLVLGDARNNDNDPGIESFKKISERSRNLFWLNPDKRHLWDWNDSIASIYGAFSTEMKEVNNFIDLSEFIDKLFVDI